MVHSVKTLAPHTCSHGHSSHMASLSVLWSWSLAVYLWWRRTMRSWWEKKWRIIEINQAVPDLFPGSLLSSWRTGIIPTVTFLLGMKWLAGILLAIDR